MKDDAVSTVFITLENSGGRFTAQITIDAIGIDVPGSGGILGQSTIQICHMNFFLLYYLVELPTAWWPVLTTIAVSAMVSIAFLDF